MTHWQLNLLKQLFVHQYVRNSISVPEDMSYLMSYAVDEQMALVKNLNEEDTISKIKESSVNYDELMKQVKETYVVQPKRMNAKTDQLKNTAIEMTAVDEYKFTSNFDIVENLSNT